MIKINDKNKTCLKNISIYVLKTLFYFAILLVLVYLYSYSGIGAAKFIYKDF